jgi:AspT/YidE/YbjL antiporter-like protein
MEWFRELIMTPSMIQTVLLICIVSAIGLQLGKLKVFNVSLGTAFVFFTGIFAGHFNIPVQKDMLYFAQSFGLILFIYSLGLQVGPSFFNSLKKGGLRLNILSLSVAALGLIMILIIHFNSSTSLTDMVGILSGATTNTPVLGAAQQTYHQIVPDDNTTLANMALACAISYPFGVVGVIFVIVFLRKGTSEKFIQDEDAGKKAFVSEYVITNPQIAGKDIQTLMKSSHINFVFSRIWRKGNVFIPTSESVLNLCDHVLIISKTYDVEQIKTLLGEQEHIDWNKKDIDWNHVDNSNLVSRRIIVTQNKVNGVELGKLKLRNNFGINITRVDRGGIELLPSRNLVLQIGDKLTVVGEKAAIENVVKILGDELKRLRTPNLISIFIGIALGLLLGALPIPFPGLSIPVKLGIAGGPVIIGILMGAFGPRLHFTTYTTQSVNLMFRQIGIVTYLACLGIDSGAHFLEILMNGNGLIWMLFGIAVTVVPIIIIGLVSLKLLKIDFATTAGMLCGSMANPMALNYLNSTVEGDRPVVSYATVYPVTMFVRIISIQLLLMFMV